MPESPRPHIDRDILQAATRLRRALHANPETAHEERTTARMVEDFLRHHGLRPLRTRLGGHGLLYRLEGSADMRPVLLRADLDALPIQEQTRLPYASRVKGKHHACGHDGHMAMLAAGLAQLRRHGGDHATVYAAFQPAEETGEGAERFLKDAKPHLPKDLRAFAIHNFPGLPIGSVGLRKGTAAKPSMGLDVTMTGRRSHASEPQHGRNPIPTLSTLARWIQKDPVPAPRPRRAFGTIVGMNSGPNNYGVSPATASLALTLRGERQRDLDRFLKRVMTRATTFATTSRLDIRFEPHDVFRETRNHPTAVRDATTAIRRAGLRRVTMPKPLAASEDFGRFTEQWPGALLLLGAGERHAPLHAGQYDFPDALLERGARVWMAVAEPRPGPEAR